VIRQNFDASPKEKAMNSYKSALGNVTSAAFTILALCLAVTPNASAKHHDTSNLNSATVVAHLPLPGPAATDLSLQGQNGHQYLYVDQSSKDGVTIIDVTNPAKPVIINHVAWPDGNRTGRFEMVGTRLALVASRGSDVPPPSDVAPSTETVNVLDLSDPANPRTIESFSGVTSVLTEGPRNLVYFTNDQGLWILSMHRDLPLPACTTADATAIMPACQ
jgi:hypothetical protein